MGSDKRRSDRLLLTVPLRLEGLDAKGVNFKETARTVTLNRHGARVSTARLLHTGETLRVTNLVSHREANFRVVGPLSPHSDKGGEWGLESLNGEKDIWGIRFPQPPGEEGAESAALLECRKCHSVALLHVSLVETEVLETAGLLTHACDTCASSTPWGYAEKQVAMGAPLEESAMVAEAVAAAAAPRGSNLRRHRRVGLQLPVLVRDYSGQFELTKSENVSKGGFCFASERNFHIGEGVVVACPYSNSDRSSEVSAKIVRQQPLQGTNRKFYGVRYDKQPS